MKVSAQALRQFSNRLESRPFQPHRFLKGGHSQTIVASRLPRRFPWGWQDCLDEEIETRDRIRVAVRSVRNGGLQPTVIVLHGMTGCTESGYMKGFSHKAWRLGWGAALPNLYNLNANLDSPFVFHAGSSAGARGVLERIVETNALTDVYLVGVSMGANILLKLLGEWGEARPGWIRSAAAVSPLIDLRLSWQMMERPRNRIYQIYFTRRLREIVRAHADKYRGHVDLSRVEATRTIREFDDVFTAPLGGYRDAFHYYEENSASDVIDLVRVPTLILHAKDDPFLPWEPLTRMKVASNPNLLIRMTRRGGHLGFLENDGRSDPDRSWAENRVMEFFQFVQGKLDDGDGKIQKFS